MLAFPVSNEFHKEKKVQRVKVLVLLSQGRERARCISLYQHGGVRALSFYGVMGGGRVGSFS